MNFQFNNENVVILAYVIICLIINIQSLVERLRKKNKEDFIPTPDIKLDFQFFFITLIAILFTRGFAILLFIILFKNVFLKIFGLILFATDFLLTYWSGFTSQGEAKPVNKLDYCLRTIHLFLVISFDIYFIIYYYLLN